MSDPHAENTATDSAWADPDHTLETDDEWHEHTGEEPPQVAHGSTSPGVIALVGVVSFALMAFTVWVILVLFNGYLAGEDYRKEDLADLGRDTAAAKAEATSILSTTGWTDPANDLVHVPIEDAIEHIVKEYQAVQ